MLGAPTPTPAPTPGSPPSSPPVLAAVWPSPTGARAGWYPDAYVAGGLRYYDGHRWTHQRAGALPTVAPAVPHPVLPARAGIGAVVVLIASLLTSSALLDAVADERWGVVRYLSSAVALGYGPSLLWCWFASRRWGTGHLLADLGVRLRWWDALWGPLVWFGSLMAAGAVAVLIEHLDVPTRSNIERDGLWTRDRTLVVSLVVAAVVIAPIVEEVIFRGLVLRGLLSVMTAPLAVVLQGVLFGAAHIAPSAGWDNLGLVLVLSAVGCGFGLGAYLTRRVGAGMIAHSIYNGVVIAVVLHRSRFQW